MKESIEVIMKYKVNIKKTEEGYSVWVPGLPGCSGHNGIQKKRL